MLTDLRDDGTMTWICTYCKSDCQAHISHPQVVRNADRTIDLPPCETCVARGTPTTLSIRAATDEELTPPTITRDELTGQILQVAPTPGYEAFDNHWGKVVEITHTPIPHPTLAHLSPQEIQAMQEQIKAKAPDAPIDWMLTTQVREKIHAVFLCPWVERHREVWRRIEEIQATSPSIDKQDTSNSQQ
jgi:hypothetical protein